MPIDTEKIIDILSTIANEDQMKVTITQCIRAGVITGLSAGIGGLLGGPIGVALAAAAGGGIAAATGQNFESVVSILTKMEPEKKERLADNVRTIIGNIGVTDVAMLTTMISGNATLRREIANELVRFLHNEMQMAIAN